MERRVRDDYLADLGDTAAPPPARSAIWSVTDELNNGLRGVALFDVLGDSKL